MHRNTFVSCIALGLPRQRRTKAVHLSARRFTTTYTAVHGRKAWYIYHGDGIRLKTTRQQWRGDNPWNRLVATGDFHVLGTHSSVQKHRPSYGPVALVPSAH
jgi:hypothetical protein